MSARRTNLLMQASVQMESQKITNAPTPASLAVGKESYVISLNVLTLKALIKVGEIVKLLYETSKGLKIYCRGDNYLFVRMMFQRERRAVF